MATMLDSRGIRLFDTQFVHPFRDAIRAHAEKVAADEGVTVELHPKDEDLSEGGSHPGGARRARRSPGTGAHLLGDGAVSSYEPWHDKTTGNTFLRRDSGKCLHYYFYFIDEVLGLCFFAVPTWAPFRALFYFNGHNWLASKLRRAKVAFDLNDNASADVADWQKAQDLADGLMVTELHARMDAAVARYCPVLEPLGRYHWSIMQAEYATDIVFRSPAVLAPLYDHLLRTAILAVKVSDVGTFLGRSSNRPGDREAGGDFSIRHHGIRIEGTRVRHYLGPASIRCTTSTVSSFASRRRRTTSHSSDTTAWWNRSMGSGS